MEKEENKVIETVENSTKVNEETIIDNNTEIDSSDYNPDETGDPVVDTPVEEPTLAPTDDIIPAPVDVAGEEPIADPVVDPIIPETPPTEEPVLDAPLADIAPPMQDIPVNAPVDAPVEEPGSEVTSNPIDVVDPIIPEDPAPIVSDVTPECGDENPTDGCCSCSPVTVANLFGTLQESVTIAWRFHLKTRKHHIHVALNDFYYGALNLVDQLIEEYQGICGVIEDVFTNCVVGDGKTEGDYLTELKAFVENNRCCIGNHSELQSKIDDILGLIDSTIYKVTSFCENAIKSFDEFVYEDYPAIKESYHYDRFGERYSDDPDDSDYDPDLAEEE